MLDAARSVAAYDGWLRAAILSFKYRDEPARAEHLGPLLEPLVASLGPLDALVPVPLHPKRLRERGYNQAVLLARHAGGPADLIAEDLMRTRPTRRQVGLDAGERQANVAGAFGVRPGVDLRGKRVVLIDDVLTTGATLGNCAEALRQAGAAAVAAVTLAREVG